jgi:hypothetical protein
MPEPRASADAVEEDTYGITISGAQRAYLAAFDHWLKTVWARGESGASHDVATDLLAACFEAMLAEPVADPVCVRCGGSFVRAKGRGAKRKMCLVCSPRSVRAARGDDSLPLAA